MSLRWRLFLSFAAVLLVSLGVASLGLATFWSELRERDIIERLSDVGLPLYLQSADRLRQGEPPTQVLTFLDEQTELLQVDVLVADREGEIRFATRGSDHLRGYRLNLPRTLPLISPASTNRQTVQLAAHESFRDPKDGRLWRYVLFPFVQAQPDGGARLGFFAVAQDDARSAGVWMRFVWRFALAIGLGLAAALVAALLLARWLTRPLHRLTGAIEAAASGDYSQRVPLAGPPETVALSRGFNRLAAEVERSRSLVRNFLATLSHELRTPLTALRGFEQALLDGSISEPSERERALHLMQKETQRMQRLVSQLLDLSRLQAQQAQLRLEPLDLAALVAQVADIFALRADETEIRLRNLVKPPLMVRADADRVEQVLTNLVDNALRHTPAGGVVTISHRAGRTATTGGVGEPAVGERVKLEVHNEGSYIPPEVLPHLFEPYYQGPGARSGGAGLGLAVAREIAVAHSGDLVAVSDPIQGTTFVLTLPATSSRKSLTPTSAAAIPFSLAAPATVPATAAPASTAPDAVSAIASLDAASEGQGEGVPSPRVTA